MATAVDQARGGPQAPVAGAGTLGGWAIAVIGLVGLLTLGVGLGASGRLSYHEAIAAQSARELVARGAWRVPTLGGRPWLEKPPLATWAIAGLGRLVGGIDATVARLPGALAALGLAGVVAVLAARRAGRTVGLLAGLVQLTTAWLVTRGRLAEPDVPLAAVIAAALLAFDAVRRSRGSDRRARLAFCVLLGLTALLKGVGFGGTLTVATVLAVLAWDRDRAVLRALVWPPGWALAAVIALTWPVLVLRQHPEALGLWAGHITDRLAARPTQFAGESWAEYAPAPLLLLLPWTPLALAGAAHSLGRARAPEARGGLDRLLVAWAVVPAVLVSLATVRNTHYLLPALPPWSVWAALALQRLGARLAARGWTGGRRLRLAVCIFAGLSLAWAVAYAAVLPRLDARGKGAEWAFYEQVPRAVPADEPLALLYDALDRDDRYDRLPYPTPFGPVPPDLAVRLFSLDRPAESVAWPFGPDELGAWLATVPAGQTIAVIARERDRPTLERFGPVQAVAAGPTARWDRAFVLYRLEPTLPGSAEAR